MAAALTGMKLETPSAKEHVDMLNTQRRLCL